MKITIPIILIILLTSCSRKKNVGEYVYGDALDILHIDENCKMLKNGKDHNGHKIYAKIPVDTTELIVIDEVCAHCVDTKTYKHLKRIAVRNEELKKREEELKKQEEEIRICREWLYNKFVAANYEMYPYEEFVEKLAIQSKRKSCYKAACEEGWNVGTFDEFSKLLGFPNKTLK